MLWVGTAAGIVYQTPEGFRKPPNAPSGLIADVWSDGTGWVQAWVRGLGLLGGRSGSMDSL